MSFQYDPDDLAAKVAELQKKVDGIGDLLRDAVCAIARPGDTVILAFDGHLTDEDIEHLAEEFRPLKEKGIEVGFSDQVVGVTVARPDDDSINDWSDEDRYGPEDI